MTRASPIRAEQTRDLRHRVLRPWERPEEIVLPGDDDPRTGHYGVLDEGRVVAVASIVREPDAPEGAMRLRGVAVDPAFRGRGDGLAVVQACIDHAVREGATRLWLNTTPDVAPWYEGMGFRHEGEPFLEPRGRTYQRLAADPRTLSAARRPSSSSRRRPSA